MFAARLMLMRSYANVMLMCCVLAASAVTGCRSPQFATEGDVLRERVLELETQVQRLQQRNAELRGELRQARTMVELPEFLPEDIREFIPHVASISLGRLSHARDRTDDGHADVLVLYIHPVDGRGRITQMVGHLMVNAVVIPASGEAIPIGELQLSPGELRDAYRSSVTGTHYTVELPVQVGDGVDRAWLDGESATVRVTYVSGITSQRHTAERTVAMSR